MSLMRGKTEEARDCKPSQAAAGRGGSEMKGKRKRTHEANGKFNSKSAREQYESENRQKEKKEKRTRRKNPFCGI